MHHVICSQLTTTELTCLSEPGQGNSGRPWMIIVLCIGSPHIREGVMSGDNPPGIYFPFYALLFSLFTILYASLLFIPSIPYTTVSSLLPFGAGRPSVVSAYVIASSYYIVSCLGKGILTLFSLDSLYLGMFQSCSISYCLYIHFGFPLPSA